MKTLLILLMILNSNLAWAFDGIEFKCKIKIKSEYHPDELNFIIASGNLFQKYEGEALLCEKMNSEYKDFLFYSCYFGTMIFWMNNTVLSFESRIYHCEGKSFFN